VDAHKPLLSAKPLFTQALNLNIEPPLQQPGAFILEGKQPELRHNEADYASSNPTVLLPQPPTTRMVYYNEGVPLLPQSDSEPSRSQRQPNPLPWPPAFDCALHKDLRGVAVTIKTAVHLPGGRRAQSRVLYWADRELLLPILGAVIYASFESSPTSSLGVLSLYRICNNRVSLEQSV